MNPWPLKLEKLDNGRNLKIVFDNQEEFIISAVLLRVESPSAEVQGHGGPKVIVKNKNDTIIRTIEQIGNYAIQIIFSDDHCTGIYSWELLYNFGKNQKVLLENYYNSI